MKREIPIQSATRELRQYFGNFFDLTNKRIFAATRHGVSNAINALNRQTKSNIAGSWFNSSGSNKYGVGLIEGVNSFLYDNEATGIVNILGTRPANDGTWRLRFFEGGTDFRKSKHGKNYGKIRPAHFFANAVNSVNYFEIIKRSVEQAIDEINNK